MMQMAESWGRGRKSVAIDPSPLVQPMGLCRRRTKHRPRTLTVLVPVAARPGRRGTGRASERCGHLGDSQRRRHHRGSAAVPVSSRGATA